MFVNDLTGLCRSGVFGGDFTSQVPMGYQPWGNVPYGLGFNVGQGYNPALNYLYNRIPQGFAHQGFTPQTFPQVNPIAQNFAHQGFIPQTFPQVNPIAQSYGHQGFIPQVNPIAQNPFVPYFGATNVPFAGTINPHTAALVASQLGYAYNPYTPVPNWGVPQNLQGLQGLQGLGFPNTTCR